MSEIHRAEPKVLDALDGLARVRFLVEAIHMMANALHQREECNAFQRVAEVTKDEIELVRVALGDTDDGEAE
jgi:hypothetical protein